MSKIASICSGFVPLASILALALTLSACGGGGGQKCIYVQTRDHGCLTTEQFSARRDAAAVGIAAGKGFKNQAALGQSNASKAHAALAVVRGADVKPGAGVTVAFMDSGIDLDHFKLRSSDIEKILLQDMPDETALSHELDEPSHGTGTVSLLAASPVEPDSTTANDFTGLAYGASFRVYAIPLAGLKPPSGQFDWSAAYARVLADGADIVNLSFGQSGEFIENHMSDEAVKRFRADADLSKQVEVWAQTGAADPAILVWAAGNDHGAACGPTEENCVNGKLNASSPGARNALMTVMEELRGHTVVAVAVGPDGRIWEGSNRCGVAGNWCIAAPGGSISAASFARPDANQDPVRTIATGVDGTSFAAPMVSGGLALMKQFFRDQLGSRDLVTRLFATADKSGHYADTAIYGQGLIDLGAAVSPVGEARVPGGTAVGGAGHGVAGTTLQLGATFGDGLQHSLAGREIAAFDALGSPFWFDLPSLVRAPGRPSHMARLESLLDRAPRDGNEHRSELPGHDGAAGAEEGWRFGLRATPADAGSSLLNPSGRAATLSFGMENGFGATAFTTEGIAGQETPETGATLSWRPAESPLGMRVGWLGERSSISGSSAQGAFGHLSADSMVAGIEIRSRLDGWRAAADFEIGLIEPRAGNGIITAMSGLTTSAFSLRATRRLGPADEIAFSLSQPPRIESGSANLLVPTGRTRDGTVSHEPVTADIEPSGRQLDLAVQWRRGRVLGGDLRAEAFFSRNPNHFDTKPGLGLLVGWLGAF